MAFADFRVQTHEAISIHREAWKAWAAIMVGLACSGLVYVNVATDYRQSLFAAARAKRAVKKA